MDLGETKSGFSPPLVTKLQPTYINRVQISSLESSKKAGLQHLLCIELQKPRSRNRSRRSDNFEQFDDKLGRKGSRSQSTRHLLQLYSQFVCYYGFQYHCGMLAVSLVTYLDSGDSSIAFFPLFLILHFLTSPFLTVPIPFSSLPLDPSPTLSISLSW